jgi:hypothetical protein
MLMFSLTLKFSAAGTCAREQPAAAKKRAARIHERKCRMNFPFSKKIEGTYLSRIGALLGS